MNDSHGMMMFMGRMDRGFTLYCLTMIAFFIQKILVVFQTVSCILLELGFSICAISSLIADFKQFHFLLYHSQLLNTLRIKCMAVVILYVLCLHIFICVL
jgi:hypothetical protein